MYPSMKLALWKYIQDKRNRFNMFFLMIVNYFIAWMWVEGVL